MNGRLGFLMMLLLLTAAAVWLWFVGGVRERFFSALRPTATASPSAAAAPPSEQAREAVALVKQHRPETGGRTLAHRLEDVSLGLMDRGVALEYRQWRSEPVMDAGGDVFLVTYLLKGADFDQSWTWRVSVPERTVESADPLADRISGSETEVASVIDELSPAPGPSHSPRPTAAPRPQVTPVVVMSRVPASPSAAPAPAPTRAPTSTDFTLVGVVEGGGVRRALLRYQARLMEARVGDRLAGGWTLAEIRVGRDGDSEAVVTSGGERRTVRMGTPSPAGPGGSVPPPPTGPEPPPGNDPLPPPPEPEPHPESDHTPAVPPSPTEQGSPAPSDSPSPH